MNRRQLLAGLAAAPLIPDAAAAPTPEQVISDFYGVPLDVVRFVEGRTWIKPGTPVYNIIDIGVGGATFRATAGPDGGTIAWERLAAV